jgi:transketolase
MPSWELFEEQDAAYKAKVLPTGPARLVIEAGVRQGWDRYLGAKSDGIWQNGFGVSGAYKDVFKRFGFTVENVVARARALLGKK